MLVAALAVTAQPAQAARVEVRGDTLAVTPGAGERSDVNITARYTGGGGHKVWVVAVSPSSAVVPANLAVG